MNSALQMSREKSPEIKIRPLVEEDLREADRIMRLAFGTFLGLPDPLKFMGDADYVRTRWLADPSAVFGAEMNGALVGTNFVARWGSFGFFGPLTIRPDLWDRGIAQKLLTPTLDRFDSWGVTHSGLFTFATSTKHVSLYQKFGFWPRYLTALMNLPVEGKLPAGRRKWLRFSDLAEDEKEECLKACAELTSSIYFGLDLTHEIRSVDKQNLGDTVLTWNSGNLAGFAVCHVGAGTEAGSGKCYIKFGAVRSGPDAAKQFRHLLEACHEFALTSGVNTLAAGVNLARVDAYREMREAGFRASMQGIAMERNGDPGYNRKDVFAMDDWR